MQLEASNIDKNTECYSRIGLCLFPNISPENCQIQSTLQKMCQHRAGQCLICSLLSLQRRDRRWHPLQYSYLENPMDGGAWWAAVHGVMKSRTRLSDLTFTFHFHALEKEMATHSSVLAWRISGTGAPGGLPSMGSHRAGHD